MGLLAVSLASLVRPLAPCALRAGHVRRLSMSSSGDRPEQRVARSALPTADDMRRASFDQATRIGSVVCAAMQSSMGSMPQGTPAELESALKAMFSTSNGARGFFSTYFTDPAVTIADLPVLPEPLARALAQAPDDAHRALLRSLVMSTATWATHRKLNQEALMLSTARASSRASRVAVAVRSEVILDTLFQLRAACRVGVDALAEVHCDDGGRELVDDLVADESSSLAPPPDAHPTPPEQPWSVALVEASKYTPAQNLAIGVALDRAIHRRLVAGDPSYRTLAPLHLAIAAAAEALPEGRGVLTRLHSNGLLELTVARGGKLNALNAEMLAQILDAVSAASTNPSVRAVLLASADLQALSCGGDVRALACMPSWESRCAVLHLEYAAIAAVSALARRVPVVAIADGVTMGAGMGLFMACNRRLVSGRARLAMPEVAIALMPDAGTMHHLTALPPGFIGMYCALTGSTLGAADALYAGLGTAHVPEASVASLAEQLRGLDLAGLDAVLAAVCEPITGPSQLARMQGKIDSIFCQPDLEGTMLTLALALEEVRLRLAGSTAEEASTRLQPAYDWLLACKDKLAAASPAALRVTHHAVSRSYKHRVSELDSFQLELAANQQLLARRDFAEGVECVLGERKGERAKWEPLTIEDAKGDDKVKSVNALIDVAIDYSEHVGSEGVEGRLRAPSTEVGGD